jgi:hypothetical protein
MGLLNYINTKYDGGSPDIPLVIGDRYYGQDLVRDFWAGLNNSLQGVVSLYDDFPVLQKTGAITKGTAWTDIDIPAIKGIVKYSVKLSNSGDVPASVKTEDAYVPIVKSASVDNSISGSATLDGVTKNYIKLNYLETDGNTRSRAKKAGTYAFEKIPGYVLVVDSVAPTEYDLTLGYCIGDGSSFLTITNYLTTSLNSNVYDVVVNSQVELDALIERNGANDYQFISGIKSVKIKYLDGGYSMTSYLSGGDLYGELKTNEVVSLICDKGSYFNRGGVTNAFVFNTPDSEIENLWVKGSSSEVGMNTYKVLYIDSYDVILRCCRVSHMNATNPTPSGGMFSVDSTDEFKAKSSKLYDCKVDNIIVPSGNTVGFRYLNNLIGCIAQNIDYPNDGGGFVGFYQCEILSNCQVYSVTLGTNPTTTAFLECFNSCFKLTNCSVTKVTYGGGSNLEFFKACSHLVSCVVEDSDALSVASAVLVTIVGFRSCNRLSACSFAISSDALITNTDIRGFFECNWMTACLSSPGGNLGSGASYGYYECSGISACRSGAALGTTYHGFFNCDSGSSLLNDPGNIINAGNDWMDSLDAQITNKVSMNIQFT